MQFFDGCTALITGASSGIGAEFARQLAPHAQTLILVARRLDRLEALKAELDRPGLIIRCHAADLSDSAQTEGLIAALAESGESVSLLINNAGVGDHGFFEESEWSRVEAMLDVNIKALTQLTHALLPDLVRAGRGAILNVSSIASFLPIPKMAVYAASKAYVTSFTEALRAELRGTGVTVTMVCPGPVDTEFSAVAERGSEPDTMKSPDFLKVPARQVAREALEAVALDHARVIPGWIVWGMMSLVAMIPIFILRMALSQRREKNTANSYSGAKCINARGYL